MDEASLQSDLTRLDADARYALRRALFADQDRRDALAEQLLRQGALDMADLLDLLSLHDEERRRVLRLLGELEASLDD